MKKFPLLFLFFFAFACNSLFAQAPTASECKQFRTGTFYSKSMPKVSITRDEHFQTEYDSISGKYTTMSVTWTSDCTYELRLVKTNKRGEKKLWKKMKVLTITITSVEENSYRFSAVSPMFMEPVRGTLERKR